MEKTSLLCREATIKDAPDMAYTMSLAMESSLQSGKSPFFLPVVKRCMNTPGSWSQLVYTEDDLAGFVLGAPSINRKGRPIADTQCLAHLMVKPKYWGRGIGTLLLQWSKITCLQQKNRWLELQAWVDNDRACRLYEHFGFTACDPPDYAPRLITYKLDLQSPCAEPFRPTTSN